MEVIWETCRRRLLGRWLRVGGERRGEEGQDQCDQGQDSHHGSTPPSSASAFSSQNRMSMSRYIWQPW